jgi:phage terminase large subunit
MIATEDLAPVTLPEAFDGLLDPLGSHRYRVYYGGRGGAKSESFSRALLMHGLDQPLRILCARETQASMRDSVHRTISDTISDLGMNGLYTVERTRIYGATGTEFIFAGISRDPTQIKSMKGINVCWVEEAHAISEESWRVLTPTIREADSEIWVSFNPDKPDDPLYKLFVAGESPPGSLVRKVGWRDNPFLPEVLRQERADMLHRDPEAEAHVWGGEPWHTSEAMVLHGRYSIQKFTPESHWDGPYFGADWGFARDPTVLVRCWIGDGRLWIDADERGIEWSMDEIARRFRRVEGAESHVIRGDCSRPETIHELTERGLRVQGAAKWSGSVEDGIEHLRGYEEIVLHENLEDGDGDSIVREAKLWRYKTDPRTGDVLPKLVPGNDHGWDAVRYALQPMIRKRRTIELL